MLDNIPITSIDQRICRWFQELFQGTPGEGWGIVILAFLSILMAGLCAFVIGFEREYHGHAAGLRTHLLVALGSALVMIISIYGFGAWDEAVLPGGISRDPARLAAQVVTGVGFLGAGTIIQTGTDVKGLTTAATLWFVMAIGLCAGSGNFIICAIATLLALFALVGLRKIEKIASKRNPIVTLVVKEDAPVLKDILVIANRFGIVLRDIDTQIITYNMVEALRITMRCSYASRAGVTAFVDELRDALAPMKLKVSTDA